MARPRKPEEEKRKPWAVLHVTNADRESIRASADTAGLTVSQYLLSLHYQTPRRSSSRRAENIAVLSRAEGHLADIAHSARAGLSASKAIEILAGLVSNERAFRDAVLKPRSLGDSGSEADGPC